MHSILLFFYSAPPFIEGVVMRLCFSLIVASLPFSIYASEQLCEPFLYTKGTGELPLERPSVEATSNEVLGARADIVLQTGPIGLTREQLIEAFRFIETRTRKSYAIYKHSITHLPCQIEHSKALHGYVIRKIKGKGALIGHGFHKTVTKAILYGHHPKVLAECITDPSAKAEIYALKRLRGAHGIVPYYGAIKRWKKYSIFLEYFHQGSLLHLFNTRGTLDESQKLSIALDIAKGLQAMHKKKLVHRDLHAGNVLLRKTAESCHAVLVDFGKTLPVSKAKGTPQAARMKNPPEILIHPLQKIERYRVDIYALGCLLYQMVYGEHVPWADLYNVYSLHKYETSQRKWMYYKSVLRYKASVKHKIGWLLHKKNQGEHLTRYERLKLLVFKMINYEPKQRPSIHEVVAALQAQ